MHGIGMDKKMIKLSHGGGGRKTIELIENIFQKYLNDPLIINSDDGAEFGNYIMTTDSYVVKPIFFSGGDIGRLCISGTVNDLVSMGAKPEYLSIGFILEESFLIEKLEKILISIKKAAEEADIRIITGDTKVVEKGKCDGIYINTTGIGRKIFRNSLSYKNIKSDDLIIINGTIGDHGIALINDREEFNIEAKIESDVSPLWNLIKKIKDYNVKFMRDPTRGGLSAVLNEISTSANVGIKLYEDELPIKKEVESICDILGFNILEIANEGKMVIIVSKEDSEKVLSILKSSKLGKCSKIIGKITDSHKKIVTLKTSIGTERIVMSPIGEILPRIC